jgi:hypothetical protein
LCWGQKSGDYAQKGALAAAGRPQHRKEFLLGHIETESLQRVQIPLRVFIYNAQVFDRKQKV